MKRLWWVAGTSYRFGRIVQTQPSSSVGSTALLDEAATRRPRRQPRRLTGKRAFDIVVGGTAAIATIPLQAVFLAASAVAFRAFPIFSQERVGLNGEPFQFRKIRSLPANTNNTATKYELKTVKNTPFGQFIRKTHLDELLQFWSVLAGSMSIVGPRPEMPSLSDTYPKAFVENRTTVRPGITGPWQVSEGSNGLIGETPEYDTYYVMNPSWKLDIWVMIKTVSKMARMEMIELSDLPNFDADVLAGVVPYADDVVELDQDVIDISDVVEPEISLLEAPASEVA